MHLNINTPNEIADVHSVVINTTVAD